MIDENTSKVDRKVDGKFTLAVGDNPDIYAASSVVKALEEKLDEAKEELKQLRKDNILAIFHNAIVEHEAKFNVLPTRCALNYREFTFLVEACNALEGARYQSTYGDSAEVFGVTICKGCNTEPGYFQFQTRM